MKALLGVLFSLVAVAQTAHAVEVRGAKMDASGKNILIDVSYGGGCEEHKFSLQMKGCLESMPVQCRATIVDSTVDGCEAYLHNTVSISLKEAGIVGSYYSEGSLRIDGSKGTSATIRLPSLSDAGTTRRPGGGVAPPTRRGTTFVCKTNTGAKLSIDSGARTAELITTDGKTVNFAIVDTDRVSLESMPPQDQWTFKLDDGRSVVLVFRGSDSTGTGYYIRTTGDASPSFQTCTKF